MGLYDSGGGGGGKPAGPQPYKAKGFLPILRHELAGVGRTIGGFGRGMIEFPAVVAEAIAGSIGLGEQEATQAQLQRARSQAIRPLIGRPQSGEELLAQRGLRAPGSELPTLPRLGKALAVTPFQQAGRYIASPTEIGREAQRSGRGYAETALEPIIGIAGLLGSAKAGTVAGVRKSAGPIKVDGRVTGYRNPARAATAQRIAETRPLRAPLQKLTSSVTGPASEAIVRGAEGYREAAIAGEQPLYRQRVARVLEGYTSAHKTALARRTAQSIIDEAAGNATTQPFNVAALHAIDEILAADPSIGPKDASDMVGHELHLRATLGGKGGRTLVDQVLSQPQPPAPGTVRLYHGTNPEAARLIREQGFKGAPPSRYSQKGGRGTFFSPDAESVDVLSGGGRGGKTTVLTVDVPRERFLDAIDLMETGQRGGFFDPAERQALLKMSDRDFLAEIAEFDVFMDATDLRPVTPKPLSERVAAPTVGGTPVPPQARTPGFERAMGLLEDAWRGQERANLIFELYTSTKGRGGATPEQMIWRTPDGDMPVEVTRSAGVKDGREYVRVKGSRTAIPVDELVPFQSEVDLAIGRAKAEMALEQAAKEAGDLATARRHQQLREAAEGEAYTLAKAILDVPQERAQAARERAKADRYRKVAERYLEAQGTAQGRAEAQRLRVEAMIGAEPGTVNLRAGKVAAPETVKPTTPEQAYREGMEAGVATGKAEGAMAAASVFDVRAKEMRYAAERQAFRLTEFDRPISKTERIKAVDRIDQLIRGARKLEAAKARIEASGQYQAEVAAALNEPAFRKGPSAAQMFQRGQQAGRVVEAGRTFEQQAERYGQRAATARARAEQAIARAMRIEDLPTVAGAPDRWQPLYDAFKQIADDIDVQLREGLISKEDAQTAKAAVPRTWSQILDVAMANGFDPSYMPDMTIGQVRSLAEGRIKPGAGFPDVEPRKAYSGSRTKRTRALEEMGETARNAELLRAAYVRTYWEGASHYEAAALIDNDVAIRLPRNAAGEKLAPPPGYKAWDPDLHARNEPQAEYAPGKVYTGTAEYMIPDAVANYLKRSRQQLISSPFGRAYDKVQDVWRDLVLLVSPRWYANNFIGNMLIAVTHGVGLKDFVDAYKVVRGVSEPVPGVKVRGAAIPGRLRQASLVSRETGYLPESPIIREGKLGERIAKRMRDANAYGGKRAVAREVTNVMRRTNTVVDEIARTAMALHELRDIPGGTPFERLNNASQERYTKAVEAGVRNLVDYGDMSWFERKMVRRIVPFYSWQKGILKVALRLPMNHPLRATVLVHLANVSRELQEDRRYENPAYLRNYLPIGTSGKYLAVRGMNPFADATGITTVDGVVSSLQPLVEAFIRSGFHISGRPFGPQTVDSYGNLVDDVRLSQEINQSLQDTPLIQTLLKVTGLAKPTAQETTRIQALLKFLGVNLRDVTDLEKVRQRTEANLARAEASRLREEAYQASLRAPKESPEPGRTGGGLYG